MINILVVDDEEAIANLIKITLNKAGYVCQTVYDGEAAVASIEKNRYDLILLDIMLPKIDGYELMTYIKNYNIPVIFLTAKNDVKDKVKGLRMGAEDYIVKPFDSAELIARVEVVMRRFNKNTGIINIAGLTIDEDRRIVSTKGNIVNLTYKEYELLLLLVKNKNIALYRDIIYEKVWQDPYCVDTRTVDLHVQRLRKKLDMEEHIKTVYKVGYCFEE